jgi:hypothetical protein
MMMWILLQTHMVFYFLQATMLYDTVLVIEEMMMLVKYPSLLNVYSNGNAQAAYAGGFNTSTKASKNVHVAANEPNDVISSYSSLDLP